MTGSFEEMGVVDIFILCPSHASSLFRSSLTIAGTKRQGWPRRSPLNVHLSNTPTINVSTLGLRVTYSLQPRSLLPTLLPTVLSLHLRVSLHRLQERRVMESISIRPRRKRLGVHIPSAKPRSLRRSAARSGRVIGRVLLLVFLLVSHHSFR
jgi:hypothetical protein